MIQGILSGYGDVFINVNTREGKTIIIKYYFVQIISTSSQ